MSSACLQQPVESIRCAKCWAAQTRRRTRVPLVEVPTPGVRGFRVAIDDEFVGALGTFARG